MLRNPWGNFEWKGNWGDSSNLWTPELKKKVDFKDVDDGSFWMCFEDFSKYFSRVGVNRIAPNCECSGLEVIQK